MNRYAAPAVLVLALAVTACQPKSPEDQAKAAAADVLSGAMPPARPVIGNDIVARTTRHMNHIAELVEQTHDEASARRAAEAIAAAESDFKAFETTMDGKTDAEKTAMLMANQGQIAQAQARVVGAMMKLAMTDTASAELISHELDKIPSMH